MVRISIALIFFSLHVPSCARLAFLQFPTQCVSVCMDGPVTRTGDLH